VLGTDMLDQSVNESCCRCGHHQPTATTMTVGLSSAVLATGMHKTANSVRQHA